jgi:hypothetical protein
MSFVNQVGHRDAQIRRGSRLTITTINGLGEDILVG